MAEIRHLENWHDVIFFCWGWSDLDKFSQTGAEWHVDCGDMVKIEIRFRIPTWRTFGWIPWHVISQPPATLQGADIGQIQQHVIPEPRITLQGAATWWIHCHDSRATCHIAGCSHLAKSMLWSCHNCNNSIRHIENRISPYFFGFLKRSLGFDERRLSYHLRYTCCGYVFFLIVWCTPGCHKRGYRPKS